MWSSRNRAGLILSACLIGGLGALLAFGFYWHRQDSRNRILQKPDPSKAASKSRPAASASSDDGLSESVFSGGPSSLRGDFSRPTLRPDPEMFGRPELIPLTPGAGVGRLQPLLSVDQEMSGTRPTWSSGPVTRHESLTLPDPAWDSPLTPPSVAPFPTDIQAEQKGEKRSLPSPEPFSAG